MNFLIRISHNRILQHSSFWALYLSPCIYSLIAAYGEKGLIPASGIIIITLCICYFNLYFLIPRYLLREKFITYGVLLVSLTLVYALLWTLLFITCLKFVFHSTAAVNFPEMYFGNLLEQSVTIAITTALKLSKGWYRQYLINKELETQNLYAELKLLKAQINPHFLFNTLNNLYALTLKKSDLAPETVLKLSNIMEYMIYDSNETTVPVEKELQYLQDYIDLERLRQNDQSDIRFRISGHVNGQKIAPLLLLPFVENAFKHGINKMASNGKVDIRVHMEHQNIVFISENKKPENAAPEINKGKGRFGINNVLSRLDLIYKEHYDLVIDDGPDLYTVNLNIQLI
jgi:two-component system, LytTR family, sensor kinase